MKLSKFHLAMAGALVAIFAVGTSADAYGQATPPAKIAILEFQRIMLESAAAIDIKVQVDQRRLVYQNEITKQEQVLRAAEQELARQATILAPDALAQKRREFEGRVAEVQTGMQARKRELDQAFAYGMNEVQRTLTMIIAALAKERGFNLVLPHAQIVFSDSSLNITDDALRRLNAQLPSVKVPLIQN
ncbi:MAG: OmpH family outer membrane protein [Alphaproteobacteria bacterium]